MVFFYNVSDVVSQITEGQEKIILNIQGSLWDGGSFYGNSELIKTSVFLEDFPIPWAPKPNPMTWSKIPTLVRADQKLFLYNAEMTATQAVNPGGGTVEYFFDCRFEDEGTFLYDSKWQTSPEFIRPARTGTKKLFYRVKARNQKGVETEWSDFEELKDRTSPTPNPMMWEGDSLETIGIDKDQPYKVGEGEPKWIMVDDPIEGDPDRKGWAITMTATEAHDDSGRVEYYFYCLGDKTEELSSDWQKERTYTTQVFTYERPSDNNLPQLNYTFQVWARDETHNITEKSWPVKAWDTQSLRDPNDHINRNHYRKVWHVENRYRHEESSRP
jgi:hypothetical protein